MKIGYMYQWYAPRYTDLWRSGSGRHRRPLLHLDDKRGADAFSTDNGPVSNVNVLKNHALFFQDKFQVMSKLTLNYGIRFDQYRSSYPEQRFGLNGNRPCVDDHHCDVGPFAVTTVTPARDVVTFNTVVPRVALIYDVFGNSKTALKASWGRYATNPAESISSLVNPIDLITKKYAWDNNYLTADPEVAATRITPAYVATLQPILGGAQLTPATVDPNLTDWYTDEYTFGVEQEIAGDLRGYFTLFGSSRRTRSAGMTGFGRCQPTRRSRPSIRVPTASSTAADDRTITVWETSVPPIRPTTM